MQEEKINGRMKSNGERSKEAEERRAKWSARGRRAMKECAWGILAWLIGGAPLLFGTYPLGVALLCGTGKHKAAILTGLLLSALSMGEHSAIYVCAYLAAALVRVLSGLLLDSPESTFPLPRVLASRLARQPKTDGEEETAEETEARPWGYRALDSVKRAVHLNALTEQTGRIFSESVCLRMGAAGVAALLVGLYRCILGGFRFYDWFGALFAVSVAVSATAVYSVSLEERCTSRVLLRISEGAILFSAAYASAGVTLFSLPLSPMLSLLATLAVCHTRGSVQGIVAAAICGLASVPLWIPAYLLAALAYLFFHGMEKEGTALALSVFCALSWIGYASGAQTLLWAIPAALLAGVCFSLFCRLVTLEEEKDEASPVTDAPSGMGDVRYRDANERLQGISEALSSLSEVFYNLSDRMRRPGALDLRRVCDRAFDTVCADCPNRERCWGVEYAQTVATLNGFIAALHTRGRVSGEEIEERLKERCTRTEALVAHVNSECARLTGEMLRNNRTEIFAMDYEGASQIINEALLCEEEEYSTDPALERRVAVYLADAGVETTGVSVYGKRRRRILIRGADVENARVTAEIMRADLGEMCETVLHAPVLEVENGGCSMVFRARQRLGVTVAKRNISADGGVSGDSINLFCNKREYFYALISDGMGAGRAAALTSGLCSTFLERMLRAGNRAATSLRMLNNMIRSRSADSADECSSTVDLLELDLMTGRCTFFKSGAAPSFVIRGGVVRRMQSGSAPIGIMCALDSRETTFDLQVGDVVVMISDGILDASGESDDLIALLTEEHGLSPDALVERICADAAAREGHDDLSAVAIRIGEYDG